MDRRPRPVKALKALIAAAAAAALAPGAPFARAQPADKPPDKTSQPAKQPERPAPVRFEDLPPPIRLGLRAENARRNWAVIPTVVLVPDAASYVEALSRWTLRARYPVLIDDRSPKAAEDAARFVRAFKPERVVRWAIADEPDAAAAPWPQGPADRRKAVEGVQLRVWHTILRATPATRDLPAFAGQRELIDAWKKAEVLPPGVVVASIEDPAWPAALALAIGRAQPILWTSAPTGLGGDFSPIQIDRLASELERFCEETTLPWRGLGDTIDAVTLALNCPARVRTSADDRGLLATTDLLTRIGGGPDVFGPREKGAAWAYAGQVFGSEAESAYAAMSALFLQPAKAWGFDGYGGGEPWERYRMESVVDPLARMGATTSLVVSPKGTELAWRASASRALDAGLVLVNSKGDPWSFELDPGRLRPGEIPILRVPAIVYFVHSFSASSAGDRGTVAGRWIERGAYAYVGAVHEPFLQSFPPPKSFAARLASTYAWGAVPRGVGAPAWKIAVFGDPLLTLGPAPPRSAEPLPLTGSRDADDDLKAAVQEKRLADAIRLLTLLGRDGDAARLSLALLHDDAAGFTGEMAAWAVMPVFREHGSAKAGELVALFSRLSDAEAAVVGRRDALWNACWPELATTADEKLLGTLRSNLRREQLADDAATLAPAVARVLGREAASSMLAGVKEQVSSDADRRTIDAATRKLSGR